MVKKNSSLILIDKPAYALARDIGKKVCVQIQIMRENAIVVVVTHDDVEFSNSEVIKNYICFKNYYIKILIFSS